MANSPVITGLSTYVEEHNLPLIAKTVIGAKSSKIFNLMTDVKGSTKLNLLGTDIAFQSGAECGWSESGTTELSQRQMDAKPLKINMAFCDKTLLSTWANYQVKVAAGLKTLPFEEEFVNDIIKNVNKKVDNLIYYGNDNNSNEFDGIITILESESFNFDTMASGTPIYTAVKQIYMGLPEGVADADDCVILMSSGNYRKYIQELVAANLYHWDAKEGADNEYVIPGTSVKVISIGGLDGGANGNDYIIAGRLSNLFYGTDMQGDENKVDLWYSKDNREFRLAIEFVAGAQVAYPSELKVAKIAQ